MADRVTPEQRSRNMAAIRGRDTGPELRLRSTLHRMGLRFRVCRRDLPGKPDVVFSKASAVRPGAGMLLAPAYWLPRRPTAFI